VRNLCRSVQIEFSKGRVPTFAMDDVNAPNPERFESFLHNREWPGRVPFFEIGVDAEVVREVVGRELGEGEGYYRALVEFYGSLGYDAIPMGVNCYQEDTHLVSKTAKDTAILSRGVRSWAPMDGVVKTRRDYEEFPWADPDRPQTDRVEGLARVLPEGMGIVAVTVCVQEPLAERIMGVKALSRALYRDPELVRDVCARLGEPAVSAARAAAGLEGVAAVCVCDDFGYRSGTLLSPNHLKKYILPWHRKLVRAVHGEGKPAILHSCGNLQGVMDEVIDYCGYDVKHAFEDSHTPIALAKKLWGDRISLCGGIDMDFLARRSVSKVREYVREQLEACAGKGYALGSGNSVANYIPVKNFLAMLKEGRRFRPKV